MRISQSTIDSNVRMTKAKIAVLEAVESSGLSTAEWEVVLAELAVDAARYRLRAERENTDKADTLLGNERDEALAKVAKAEALAEKWRYKGEFGWGPWQEGHGPDMEGQILDECSSALREVLK